MNENSIGSLYDLAVDYYEKANFNEMYKVVNEALEIDPQDEGFLMMKMEACLRLEKFREAIEAGELLRDIELLTSEYRQMLGVCYSSVGEFKWGIKYIVDSIMLGEAVLTLDGRTALAWSNLYLGNYDQAFKQAIRCVRIKETAYMLYLLGSVYHNLGETTEGFFELF